MQENYKRFKPTEWAIDNRTSILILTGLICLFGYFTYNSLPKENFPEVVIPTIYVSTAYPGTSPVDIENLVTRPIEKEVKSVTGVKKVTSNSVQDFSSVIVEFNTDVDPAIGKNRVKDAVDRARAALPSDLPADPAVLEVNFSELPIMNINISGNYDLNTLKKWAEELQDEIESLPEITRAELVGGLDREIEIDVDMYKMQAAMISMVDIQRAVASENITMSAGTIEMGNMDRSLRVAGEFSKVEQIEDIIVRSMSGAQVRLKEIATVKNDYAERESYARFDGKNVITLNVIKRSGENLIEASDQIKEIKATFQTKIPNDVTIAITADQSNTTRTTITDLINSIIIGFILVTIVLMFFMGPNNAMFVGLSVPISIFIAFMVMPSIDFTLNLMVLFSFLFSLGIVVDDAIVVIENTHRIFNENKGKLSIAKSAKIAAGEVFMPVLTGTLTTIAPFIPLVFWPGIAGQFMKFLPITIMLTLLASLLVSYLINPVFAVLFMKYEDEDSIKKHKKNPLKGFWGIAAVMALIAIPLYLTGNIGWGNLVVFLILLILLNRLVLRRVVYVFNDRILPAMMRAYASLLKWTLRGKRSVGILIVLAFIVLPGSVALIMLRSPKIDFFPSGDPNFIYVYMKLPVGTDIELTDSLTQVIEKRVVGVMGEENHLVESIVANVGIGAGDPMNQDRSVTPHKGKVSVAFVEYSERNGESTGKYLTEIRDAVQGIPGAEIAVEQDRMAPQTTKPINIEVSGEDISELAKVSGSLKRYLDSLSIAGVEELKSDFESSNPEIVVNINRDKALREGISTQQIAMGIRNGVFGAEISSFREAEDEYPIMLRYDEAVRNNIDALLSSRITYRDMNMGGLVRSVPLSTVADVSYSTTYGGINRIDMERVITLSSNLLSGFTTNEVNESIAKAIEGFDVPDGVTVSQTGETEDQKEATEFLTGAFGVSFLLIFLILVLQFNSFSKPIIILTQVIFSVIGVLLGFAITGMNISIVMTGFGIVGLGGIVVKNGILLVEFMDEMQQRGKNLKEAVIEGGKMRLQPVLLTAISTILGLLAMAVGFNINFATLFTEFDPNIFFGGDNVKFFGPLSWTIIFGLLFATLLTLVVLPAMYYLLYRIKDRGKRLVTKIRD